MDWKWQWVLVIRLIWLQGCPSTFQTEFSFKELFYVLSMDISLRHIIKTHTVIYCQLLLRSYWKTLASRQMCTDWPTTSKPFLNSKYSPLYNTTPSINQLGEVIHLQAEFFLTIHSLELWRIPFQWVPAMTDFCFCDETVDSFVWDLQMSTFCRSKSLG